MEGSETDYQPEDEGGYKAKHYNKIKAAAHDKNYVSLYYIVPNLDVLSLFNSMIRPVLELGAPAFQSLLTQHQAEKLERLQRRAF